MPTKTRTTTASPMVKTIGCAICWRQHITAFTRRCLPPTPANLIL